MTTQTMKMLVVIIVAACLGAAGHALLSLPRTAAAQTEAAQPTATKLDAELEEIKGRLPDQSHAMKDVGYHFSNLWFAGKEKNWPLAHFYWSETRSHLHWAVRIIPVRKDSTGAEIKLAEILDAVENSPLKQLEDAINAGDNVAFEKAYRFTIEGCYSCHKAADKPYLRLKIPTQPETTMINTDPNATWPR